MLKLNKLNKIQIWYYLMHLIDIITIQEEPEAEDMKQTDHEIELKKYLKEKNMKMTISEANKKYWKENKTLIQSYMKLI